MEQSINYTDHLKLNELNEIETESCGSSDMIIVNQSDVSLISIEDQLDQDEIELEIIDENETYRTLKLYSATYPFLGIYYTLRHPIMLAPIMLPSMLKSGLVLGLSYPLLFKSLSWQTTQITNLISQYKANKLLYVLIPIFWLISKGLVIDYIGYKVVKFFSRKLLVPLVRVVSNHIKSISLKVKPNSNKAIKALKTKITFEPGNEPELKARPIAGYAISGLAKTANYILPKPRAGFLGWFQSRILPVSMQLILPPGAGLIVSSLISGQYRGPALIQPYIDHQARQPVPTYTLGWSMDKKFQLHMLGFSATLLERLPMVGPLFVYTNLVGTALWLATYHPDLNKNLKLLSQPDQLDKLAQPEELLGLPMPQDNSDLNTKEE